MKGLEKYSFESDNISQELWTERTEGEPRLPQRWWVEMNGRNRVQVLDPTGAQGQGSTFKPAGWEWAASWPEGVGSGQVAGQGPGNLDMRTHTWGWGGGGDEDTCLFSPSRASVMAQVVKESSCNAGGLV